MGKIEERVKLRAKREHIQDIVLKSLLAVSAVGLIITAPNAVHLLKYVEKYVRKKEKLNRRVSQAVSRLISKGLVERSAHGKLVTTPQGKRFAESLERYDLAASRPARWDGKWRIVIFDVWERRRSVRDRLRILLKRNGFIKIQNSVWVYPYDCEELLAFLRTDLSLGRGICYIVADEIEHDTHLRSHFKLR